MVANGPEIIEVRSMIRYPSKGPGMLFPLACSGQNMGASNGAANLGPWISPVTDVTTAAKPSDQSNIGRRSFPDAAEAGCTVASAINPG
jgi:hypothetical protein